MPDTGAFTWTPGAAGTYTLTVRVTDNGQPAASDFETITVTVLGEGSFTGTVRRGTNLEMQWSTQAGKQYAIEATPSLSAPVLWTPLQTNTATGTTLTYTNTTTPPPNQRFFRIRIVQ